MRTRDFSAAPPLARAAAMLTLVPPGGGYAEAASPRWLLQVRRRLGRAPGLVRREWLRPGPRPAGVVAFFGEVGQAEEALAALHEAGVAFQVQLHEAHPKGYSNGIWRAEGNQMAHIERFSRLEGETRPPRVAGGDQAGEARASDDGAEDEGA